MSRIARLESGILNRQRTRGGGRKIVQNAIFHGKRHDNKILKVKILLSSNFVVMAQAPGGFGFGKRGLLEKGSFQKSIFSRDSREFRDSRDFREPPDCGKPRGIRPLFPVPMDESFLVWISPLQGS